MKRCTKVSYVENILGIKVPKYERLERIDKLFDLAIKVESGLTVSEVLRAEG